MNESRAQSLRTGLEGFCVGESLGREGFMRETGVWCLGVSLFGEQASEVSAVKLPKQCMNDITRHCEGGVLAQSLHVSRGRHHCDCDICLGPANILFLASH
jgi:hypothetical protein